MSLARLVAGLAALAPALVACERAEPSRSAHVVAPAAGDGDRRAATTGAPTEIVVLPPDDDAALAAAVAEARATVDEARDRWLVLPAEQRDGWFVKWAAPLAGSARVEHVWVRPLHWSAFRVEGRLASAPRHELACGRGAGELVGFPAEELTDWVHLLDDDDPAGPREGGYTIELLEAREAPAAP